MPEVKALVTSDQCPHCAEMKDYLSKKGLLEKVKIYRYETDEGKKFCEENHITEVPECMVLSGENGKARICSPAEFHQLLEDGK